MLLYIPLYVAAIMFGPHETLSVQQYGQLPKASNNIDQNKYTAYNFLFK